MEIYNFGADCDLAAILAFDTRLEEELFYVVDKDNKMLVSVNGNIYSKDMSKLYLISPTYKDRPYYMPDTVTEVICRMSNCIRYQYISCNLEAIKALDLRGSNVLDFRNTKLSEIGDYHFNFKEAVADKVRFPVRTINTLNGSLDVNANELIFKNSIVAVFGTDTIYTAPSGPEKFVPSNQFSDILLKTPLRLQKVILSDTIREISYKALDCVDRFEVSSDNPVFTVYEGCLYQQTPKGKALIHIPKDITRLHLAEDTAIIAEYAAHENCFQEIIFPENLQEIGTRAFYKCTFECDINVYSDEIFSQAFAECQGRNITIHTHKVHDSVFARATFETIDLSYASSYSLSCARSAFSKSKIKNIIFPVGLEWIAPEIFIGAIIDEVDFSATDLQEISRNAFYSSTLRKISLPRTIRFISCNAFAKTKLSEFILETDNDVEIYDEAFSDNQLQKVIIPRAKYAGIKAFMNNPALYEIDLPDSMEIKKSTFYKCPLIRKKIKELYHN